MPPTPSPVAAPADADVSPPSAAAPTPTMVTGPAAILAPDASIAPLAQAAFSLPAATPRPAQTPPSDAAPSPFPFDANPVLKTRKKRRGVGKTLALLVVLAGLGTAGAVYGPGLYEEYVEERGESEPAAPLAFPRARPTTVDVRTATFVIEGLSSVSEAAYTVTVDFETRLSRVVIDREDAPDLEVLTFSDDALVRRLDSSTWYQIERGAFPLDEQLERDDWIRQIDELVPPDRRSGVSIDEATVSTVAGTDTRRLLLTLDPQALATSNLAETLDPISDIAQAAETAPDETGESADELIGAPEASEQPVTNIDVAPPAATASGETIQIELWVDNHGIIRRSVGADVLGATSVTILETTPDPWVPDYPDAGLVEPMTAAALIELGI